MATYIIKSGDTLSKIAKANGTTVAALASANGIADPNKIRAGATLTIPSNDPVVSSQPVPSPNMTPSQQAAWNNAIALIPQAQTSTTSSYNATDGTISKAEADKIKAEQLVALGTNPVSAAHIAAGNTAESLAYASSTGDLSGLVDAYGQPFSLEDQQKALAQATEDTSLFYEAQKQKETQDTEAALKQKQLDYQNYLATSKTNFEADKATLDQNAANQGVLFSGGRAQKEQSLQSKYTQDQAYKQASVGADIGSMARDYQYKYGNDQASNLSSYYNLGSNQYNTNRAQGGVTSGGLSSVYSTGNANFQGTQNVAQKAAANTRAAGYLWNKGNKLLSTSYKNQF